MTIWAVCVRKDTKSKWKVDDVFRTRSSARWSAEDLRMDSQNELIPYKHTKVVKVTIPNV